MLEHPCALASLAARHMTENLSIQLETAKTPVSRLPSPQQEELLGQGPIDTEPQISVVSQREAAI